ncbi:hypothetical protein CEY15_04315 [Dietzia natronolimnaea]|uniref:DUF2505 domain-containing protein n=1 Tax=Dietzia natronolimnaea TaxID=161920 RepID=A0A2A2WSU3_9ACTN|nr:DUF2505 domain-containing protein [Dietzia natronolimnaea]PAY24221.1 hypothetical protein CEY15_04315 [Dietzia natronolimnaea]
MATRFSHSARIDAHLETVFASYGDEAFWHDRLAAIGTPDDSLDEFVTTGDSTTVTVTQHIPDEDIPDVARKVLPGRLIIVRTSTYAGFDGNRFTTSARAEAAGGLGIIDGGSESLSEGAAVVESASGQVKVSVPLLGGKLEKLVVSHLTRFFNAETEHLNRWTAAL